MWLVVVFFGRSQSIKEMYTANDVNFDSIYGFTVTTNAGDEISITKYESFDIDASNKTVKIFGYDYDYNDDDDDDFEVEENSSSSNKNNGRISW